MGRKAVFCAIATCLAFAGCNTVSVRSYGDTGKKLDCRKDKCQIQVTVTCAPFCAATVDAYAAIVSVKNGKDKIAWELPKDSYFAFPDNNQGIVFDADGQKVFSCSTEQNMRRVVCTGTSPDFGVFKYTLSVTGALAYVPPLDPWVINN
jgi:hypothetical protein